jgi:hypothetical protein
MKRPTSNAQTIRLSLFVYCQSILSRLPSSSLPGRQTIHAFFNNQQGLKSKESSHHTLACSHVSKKRLQYNELLPCIRLLPVFLVCFCHLDLPFDINNKFPTRICTFSGELAGKLQGKYAKAGGSILFGPCQVCAFKKMVQICSRSAMKSLKKITDLLALFFLFCASISHCPDSPRRLPRQGPENRCSGIRETEPAGTLLGCPVLVESIIPAWS